MLHQGHEVPFSPASDKLVLANEMGSFFVEKINDIHTKLDSLADCLHDSNFDYANTSSTTTLNSFTRLTESVVSKLTGCSPKKSCMFDQLEKKIECTRTILSERNKAELVVKDRLHLPQPWKK